MGKKHGRPFKFRKISLTNELVKDREDELTIYRDEIFTFKIGISELMETT